MAYVKKDWNDGEVITEQALDNIENGVAANDAKNTSQDTEISQLKQKDTSLESRVAALEGKVGDATTAKKGIMKQCAKVNDAAGTNVTKEEFNALLAAMKTAGMMANG